METPTRFDRLLADGLAASREGRMQTAVALFMEAAEVEPASGIPHLLIASEHGDIVQVVAAVQVLSRDGRGHVDEPASSHVLRAGYAHGLH